jgi:hypothetical protein
VKATVKSFYYVNVVSVPLSSFSLSSSSPRDMQIRKFC